MRQRIVDSLRSAMTSGLLILKLVVPLYLLADVLLYFDLLHHLDFLFAPFTSMLDLPPEAAVALAGGILINLYTAIAFAAPLDLSPYQWTVLAVFLGVCHSMIVECAIMAKLGIATWYAVALRGIGACLTVIPVLLLPASFFGETVRTNKIAIHHASTFLRMLGHSLENGLILSAKIILLVSLIIMVMDLLKSTRLMQAHIEKVNTSFSIIAGQLLGIIYGAGILLREVRRGNLSREDIFFIGTFLMLCHSVIEDVLLFVLFGANYWVIIGVRLTAALLLSFSLLRVLRVLPPNWVVRPSPPC